MNKNRTERNQPRFYMLIVNDTETVEGGRKSAYQIAKQRLKEGFWPLFKRTPHRGVIRSGDKVVVYIAGSGEAAQCFVAVAEIEEVLAMPGRIRKESELLSEPAASWIRFSNYQQFERPISIRDLIGQLSFVRDAGIRWGWAIQKGCKAVEVDDMQLIMRRAGLKKSIA